MQRPEIAVLVSAYRRPNNLRRALLSLTLQRHVAGLMEVVVTDDGSPQTVRPIVEDFARRADFPIRLTTHAHRGFRLAQCRNEGVLASTAPYLLFTDGDCILPADHVRCHLDFRRAGRVAVGDCFRLDRETSERVTEHAVRSGEYLAWIPRSERRRIARKAFRAWWYRRLGCTMLPRMTGNNVAIWRDDLERINGYDENYVGWGLEDRDLQLRLSRLGLHFDSILGRTATCHLWHPRVATFARNNLGTPNLDYFRRKEIATRCRIGLAQRVRASGPMLAKSRVLVTEDYDAEDCDAGQPASIPFPSRSKGEMLRKAA